MEADKQTLRSEMRRLRTALPDRAERSVRIWDRVCALPAVIEASTVLVFDDIAGEPHTAGFVEWCRAQGKVVAPPEAEVDPTWPDVVIVPGLAFAPSGARIGQGGGWFDRFLAQTRIDCTSIGVCFRPQLVDTVPTEAHDIAVDVVVTD
ncbi:MAG: hypothetical protein HKN44_13935 [Ilumatobacter sp.]|nr:hypothetical protein [Ilumatobacter sp.]